MTDVLVATSRDAPTELVTPLVAALGARGLEVKTVDLGRVGQTGSRLGRVVQAILGEAEAGRLVRELTLEKPRVAVAFDPGALAALVVARDRRVAATPALGVVPDLMPGARWAVDADRYAVLDDEAAVALSEHGVDGARVIVTGPLVPHGLHVAARAARGDLRRELSIPAEAAVVLIDTRGVSLEELGQLALQLSLLARPAYLLFDGAGDADVAAQLRRQVPSLGLRGKLFGDTPNAPKLWRAADVVLARPTPRALHAARAIGAWFVALEPKGATQVADARAIVERGLGAVADKLVFASSALEPLLGKRGGASLPDGAGEAAELIAAVAAAHEEVLAETFAAAAAAPPPAGGDDDESPAADVEDLGGDESPPPTTHPAEARWRRELDEARAEAERWDQRRKLAEKKGDRALAEQAAREADRKRARMHAALQELARAAASPPPPPRREEDPLAAFKRKVGTQPVKSLDDELAELKRKMEKKGRP